MVPSSAGSPAPFEFLKAPFLVKVTPLRATSLSQLLTGVTLASEWSLFFHLHQRFFQDPCRLPEYPNDFAAWADDFLGEAIVAERLANLNLVRSIDLAVVRREISVILAEHLTQYGDERHASPEYGFIFCQPRLVVFKSGRQARSPAEFVKILQDIDSDSIGYHLFAPKTAPGWVENDFAVWFKQCGYPSLAEQLDAFDPYLNSLEDNRAYLLELIERALSRPETGEST